MGTQPTAHVPRKALHRGRAGGVWAHEKHARGASTAGGSHATRRSFTVQRTIEGAAPGARGLGRGSRGGRRHSGSWGPGGAGRRGCHGTGRDTNPSQALPASPPRCAPLAQTAPASVPWADASPGTRVQHRRTAAHHQCPRGAGRQGVSEHFIGPSSSAHTGASWRPSQTNTPPMCTAAVVLHTPAGSNGTSCPNKHPCQGKGPWVVHVARTARTQSATQRSI